MGPRRDPHRTENPAERCEARVGVCARVRTSRVHYRSRREGARTRAHTPHTIASSKNRHGPRARAAAAARARSYGGDCAQARQPPSVLGTPTQSFADSPCARAPHSEVAGVPAASGERPREGPRLGRGRRPQDAAPHPRPCVLVSAPLPPLLSRCVRALSPSCPRPSSLAPTFFRPRVRSPAETARERGRRVHRGQEKYLFLRHAQLRACRGVRRPLGAGRGSCPASPRGPPLP